MQHTAAHAVTSAWGLEVDKGIWLLQVLSDPSLTEVKIHSSEKIPQKQVSQYCLKQVLRMRVMVCLQEPSCSLPLQILSPPPASFTATSDFQSKFVKKLHNLPD